MGFSTSTNYSFIKLLYNIIMGSKNYFKDHRFSLCFSSFSVIATSVNNNPKLMMVRINKVGKGLK